MSKFTDYDQIYEKEVKIPDNETLLAFKSDAISLMFESWLDEEGWELFGKWLESEPVEE